MDNSEVINGNSSANAEARCVNCGLVLPSEALSCGSCGRSIAARKPSIGTADTNLIAVTVTLGWILLITFWVAKPLSAVAVDPLASLSTTLRYSGLWTALMLPCVGLLALAAYLSWKAGGRIRTLGLQHNQSAPVPTVIAVVTLAWLWVSLLLRSEPGSEGIPSILWLLFTGLLALVWLASTTRQMHQTWNLPRVANVAKTLGYLFPFSAALVLLFVIIPGDAPQRTRFELSEEALIRYVEEFERTGGESMSAVQMVGLYSLGTPGRRDGCVTLTTNSDLDYYAGFAYCAGSPPTEPNVDFHHVKGRWWKFAVYH